jgi:hypothetical protein
MRAGDVTVNYVAPPVPSRLKEAESSFERGTASRSGERVLNLEIVSPRSIIAAKP